MKAHKIASYVLPVLNGRPAVDLTAAVISTLKLPSGGETFVWDDVIPGLGLRLRSERKGCRWIFQYRHGRQQRRVTLGALSALTLPQARKAAGELHAKVRLGQDPSGQKAEAMARSGETVGALLPAYLNFKKSDLAPRSYKEVERHLKVHCRQLHKLPLGKLDRRAVAARITAIADNAGTVTANRVRASLSAFLTWCIQRGLLDYNVAAGAVRYTEKSRSRVLGAAEIAALWTATEDGSDYSAIIRLLLLTACRASEIAMLRWEEIVGDEIRFPASRTKSRRPHIVPLPPLARTILEARPRRDGWQFMFGRRQESGFSGWSKAKAEIDQRLQLAEWTPHDLRRTCATGLGELGVPPHVIEAVLNHAGHRHGVSGIYNRSAYEAEKRTALLRWSEHVVAVIEGRESRAVPMIQGGGASHA